MSYKTYTTDALVCGTYDRNTADRSYRLFTRELGMVWADARSVRLEKSRQRMALSDFSLVRVSLVRGKVGWKVGSVAAHHNFYHNAAGQTARGYVRDFVRVVRRFVQGEEPAPDLYDFVIEALAMLTSESKPASFAYDAVVLRVLLELGYVSREKVPEIVRQSAAELPTVAPDTQQIVKKLIAQAESVSQL